MHCRADVPRSNPTRAILNVFFPLKLKRLTLFWTEISRDREISCKESEMSCESHWEENVSLADGNKWRPGIVNWGTTLAHAQWLEHSSATNVAQVWILASTSYVGWVRCWFSPLLREVFLRVLRFSPLLKNQHFQVLIRFGTHGNVLTSS